MQQLLRYLKGTQDHCPTYVGQKRLEVRGYCDATYKSCSMSTKSVTGWVTSVGGTALSWKSEIQATIDQSTTEAEFIAARYVSKECCYLKSILQELEFPIKITVYCDSTSALFMIKKLGASSKGEAFQCGLSLGT